MRKQKSIIVMTFIFIALGGIYFYMSTGSDPMKTNKAFSLKYNEEIVLFDINNEYGDVIISKKNDVWKITEPNEYSVNEEKIQTMESLFENLIINRIIEEELPEYGFKKPDIKITIQTNKGTTATLLVGNKTSSQSQYYVKDNHSGLIYIVDMGYIAPFEGSLSSFRDKNIFVVDNKNIVNIKYSTAYEKILELNLGKDENWSIQFPFESGARNVQIDEFLVGLRKLYATKYPDEGLSQKDMGLDNPRHILEITDGSGKSQIFEFGNETNGMTYINSTNEESVFMGFEVDVKFETLTPESLIYEAPLKATIDEISEIFISNKGEEYYLKIDSAEEVYSLNDNSVSRGDVTSILLRYINMFAMGYEPFEVTDEADVILQTNYNDGTKKVLKLYERDEDTYYMDYGEETKYYLSKERLESLMIWIEKPAGK